MTDTKILSDLSETVKTKCFLLIVYIIFVTSYVEHSVHGGGIQYLRQ